MQRRVRGAAGSLRLDGVQFVLVRREEYLRRFAGALIANDSGVALGDGRAGLAKRLLEARRRACLTQRALAKRLGRSQTLISLAERGLERVGERYLQTVLAACELPADYGAPPRPRTREQRQPTGWDIPVEQQVALDPKTFAPVRRGSKRDLELRRTLVWWPGYDEEQLEQQRRAEDGSECADERALNDGTHVDDETALPGDEPRATHDEPDVSRAGRVEPLGGK